MNRQTKETFEEPYVDIDEFREELLALISDFMEKLRIATMSLGSRASAERDQQKG